MTLKKSIAFIVLGMGALALTACGNGKAFSTKNQTTGTTTAKTTTTTGTGGKTTFGKTTNSPSKFQSKLKTKK